jgi:hypothetical protein
VTPFLKVTASLKVISALVLKLYVSVKEDVVVEDDADVA